MNVVNFVFTVFMFAVSIVGPTVNSETHSLTYIYTALSKPVGLPGIHQFSAMGLLDGRMIDYFDSEHQKKVPKQDWMKERLDPDYWKEGTQSRRRKQQSLTISLGILMKRMEHNDSDLHVLQWMSGCEGNKQPNGSITFHRGKYMYSYDGNDFLSFDDANKDWVAATDAAVRTKRKWSDQVQTEVTRHYLENQCMESLRKFVGYGQKQLQSGSPPEVFIFSKNTNNDKKVLLTCLATGFYPKDINLQIKRNGRVLTKEDGVVTSGVRPNDDDTFQRRDSVEILRSDTSTFTCEPNHSASRLYNEGHHKLPSEPGGLGPIIGGVVGLLLVVCEVGVLLAVLYKKDIIGAGCRTGGTYASACVSELMEVPPLETAANSGQASANSGANTAQGTSSNSRNCMPEMQRLLEQSAVDAGAVESCDVDPGAVAPPAVDPGAIAPHAVNPGAIAPHAVNPGAVAPPAVESGDVDPGAVAPPDVEPRGVDQSAVE